MQGWPLHPLGEVCEIIGGGTPSKDEKSFYQGNIPWATVRDMKGEIISSTECMITEEAIAKSSTNIIPANNVVIATRVGLGKVCLIDQDTAINQDLRGVIPKNKKNLSVRYLFWWLKSVAHKIEAEGTGATVKGVKLPFVKSLLIPVPEYAVQQCIVAILDEAFAGIATATTNAEKNLQNARELFESTLQTVFAEKGEGWVEKPISEICNIKHGFAFKGKDFAQDTDESKPIVITPGNFTEDGQLSFTEKNTKRLSAEPPKEFVFDEGDLVIVMTDLSSKMKILGKPAFIESGNILHNQRIGKIEFFDDSVDARLLYYFFMSQGFLRNIKETATGTMVKHTAPKRILSNVIPYPENRDKQQAVIEKLDALAEKVRILEDIYEKKLIELIELKQSILQKAFAGELH